MRLLILNFVGMRFYIYDKIFTKDPRSDIRKFLFQIPMSDNDYTLRESISPTLPFVHPKGRIFRDRALVQNSPSMIADSYPQSFRQRAEVTP